jgi:hypothetical protein
MMDFAAVVSKSHSGRIEDTRVAGGAAALAVNGAPTAHMSGNTNL